MDLSQWPDLILSSSTTDFLYTGCLTPVSDKLIIIIIIMFVYLIDDITRNLQ